MAAKKKSGTPAGFLLAGGLHNFAVARPSAPASTDGLSLDLDTVGEQLMETRQGAAPISRIRGLCRCPSCSGTEVSR